MKHQLVQIRNLFLKNSRNVFVVLTLSHIFFPLLAIIVLNLCLPIFNFFTGSHESFLSYYLRELHDLMRASITALVFYQILTTKHIQFILPIIFFSCCLFEKQIIFNFSKNTFWFFTICQFYVSYWATSEELLKLVKPWVLNISTQETNPEIIGLLYFTGFCLLLWWGVERLRASYLPEEA